MLGRHLPGEPSQVRKSQELTMEYYVKFVGYSAQIVTKEEAIHAMLDFVTGSTYLYVSGGHVIVPNRCALGPYIASLPACLNDLNAKSKRNMTGRPDSYTGLTHGDNQVRLTAGAVPKKVIRRLASRFRQIEPVLEHADIVGSQIERRPYSQYIDEIRATGFAKPEVHGVGVFDNGKFVFHPLNLTAVAKPTEREHVFQVEYDDGSPAMIEIPTAYRESVEDISAAREGSRVKE
jgi:hypothetical protein